jgi:predicted AlkP superfamily pyrophosphatase or phosphodiesterase
MQVRNQNKGMPAVAAGLLVAGLLSGLAVDSARASVVGRPAAVEARHPDRPTRVVQIVLDQLRPEFIDAFNMKNVKRLMRGGAAYSNAYLGHMASETVVSHNVMTSGMLPKHMGWSDEWFPDDRNLLTPPADRFVTGSMNFSQFDTLINDKGYPKLADYLHAKFPGKVVAAIGEKNYAVHTMGGPGADMRITFGSRTADCDDVPNEPTDLTWRGPAGDGVPTYISDPVCGRYYVDADKALDYGTSDTPPADMYPVEGNRDVPGFDEDHKGGDVWVTDVAFDVMDNEDWSGLLLTYGGIDKAGHMWGGLNDRPPYDGGDPHVHMAELARIADEQVGRVVQKLKDEKLLDDTLIVLTTDHGQQTSKHFFGQDGPGRGNLNWYYGADADETYLTPQPEIAGFVEDLEGNVEMSMQDSAIRTWLVDDSRKAKTRAAKVMSTLGGVRATYVLKGYRYQLVWNAHRSKWTSSEWNWWRKHGQEIVNTAANPEYGADVIGLLRDDASYGVAGDHGGAQEKVQRIPIIFSGPGVHPGARPRDDMRSVDIMPTVLRALGIPETHWNDGHAYRLP